MQTSPTDFDWSIYETGKYNDSVVLTETDKKANLRILCKEPYAQDYYDALVKVNDSDSAVSFHSKDLIQGQIYKVKAKTINYDAQTIFAEEVNTGVNITIPLKEMVTSIGDLEDSEESRHFLVNVHKVNVYGEYLGSEKKAQAATFEMELFEHFENNTWFNVKILKLIRGGYVAMYKNEVKCFIPGSHAAANVIRDFNTLLGTELNVMVDNYDAANKLFILSYKKYIEYSMPSMITELKFDTEYTGALTSHPYDFGIFVEIAGYFTGLIHASEFENYAESRKLYKAGETATVYIKDVTYSKGQYRILLTPDATKVDVEKKQWQALRNRTENNSFSYKVNKDNESIAIEIDGSDFNVAVTKKDIDENAKTFPFVKVFKVDPINKRLNFEFTKEQIS